MPTIQLKKEYVILSILFLAIVLVLYFFIFFQPGLTKLGRLKLEAKKKLQEVNEAEKVIAERGVLEKEIEKIQGKIAYYDRKLPAEKDLPKILEEFSQRADESHIKFFTFHPVEENVPPVGTSPRLYTEIPIRMDLKCGFHELGKFINSLENGERFIKITDLSITADSNNPRVHEVRLAISTYISEK